MINLDIHGFTKIELIRSFPSNGNSRTIRITAAIPTLGEASEFELTVYGETDALDDLPKAPDFRLVGPLKFEDAA